MENSFEEVDVNYNNDYDENDLDKNRRGRRSKNDNNGRHYRCEKCGKSYLSYPALYTHTKNKHDKGDLTNNRGRGRPKKDTGEVSTTKSFCNPMTSDYFKHPKRSGHTTDEVFLDILKNSLKQLYTIFYKTHPNKIKSNEILININKISPESNNEIKKEIESNIKTENNDNKDNNGNNDERIDKIIESHIFYQTAVKLLKIKSNIDLDPDTTKCEDVLSEYLIRSKFHCNNEYIEHLINFVLLYRECININLGAIVELEEGLDYTSHYTAEDIPEYANEFIQEYLDADNNQLGFNKDESIELTINLCSYMYDNNYSCSKLTLDTNSN